MQSVEQNRSWAEENQAYLVAEFASLSARLRPSEDPGSESVAELERAASELRSGMQSSPSIDVLGSLFSLTEFERHLLLLCAGVEMDSRLSERCLHAHGNGSRAHVTFGLAMAVLPEPHWSALTVMRPLRRFGMIDVLPGGTLTSDPLHIDERILHYLAGINALDPRLEPVLRRSAFPEWIADSHRSLALRVAEFVDGHAQHSPLVQLCGDDPLAHEDIAALAAHCVGKQLFTLRADDLPALGMDLDRVGSLWQRESVLLSGLLLVQCPSSELTPPARHLLETLPGPLFLSSREPVALNRSLVRIDAGKPEAVEQKQLWQRALGNVANELNGTLDDLAEQFRLSARTIDSLASFSAAADSSGEPSQLWNACRSLARPKMDDLAQRIVACAAWDDLVLPDLQKLTLRQLAAQVRHRLKVYETWGFAERGRRGLGVSALFTGPSGTGKTMAAEVLARDLNLDLYRIDLSAVVSKYIGETEKNLNRVFASAEEGGVLLLFDEADALFGKRSEVRDSHDRYANIEVGYLLQRIEAYQGLAILTTNLKSAMDPAFQRRLRFSVNFPFPDAAQREAVWTKVFPQATPTRGLDYRKLAQLNVTGGNIRNIALNAAFLAADAGTAVAMSDLVTAAKMEAQKIERPLSDSEIRGWV